MMYATKCKFPKGSLRRSATGVALAVSALLAAASVKPSLAAPSPTGFSSPDDASGALIAAARGHDERAMMTILGGGSELVRSGDTAEDALEREHVVQKYQEMHRWVRSPATFYATL